MSLFDSIYEDAGNGDAGEAGNDAGTPEPPAVLEPSTMSLQEFATEVFGNGEERPAEAPTPFVTEEFLTEEFLTEEFLTREHAVATLAPPDSGTVDGLVDGLDGLDGAHEDGPAPPGVPPLEVFSLINDDLLPTGRSDGSSLGLSGPAGLAGRGVSRYAKTALVVVVAVTAGFLGYRTLFSGGGGSSGAPAADSGGGATAPEGVRGALDTAQLAAAEAELRAAAMTAQVHDAEAGSYALPAQEWDALVGGKVVAATGTPARGVIHVVSDSDAACFETATPGGATVAAGVTEQSVAFASDSSGAGLCTTDAATLTTWAPSLIALPPGI